MRVVSNPCNHLNNLLDIIRILWVTSFIIVVKCKYCWPQSIHSLLFLFCFAMSQWWSI